jgi:hypothetical protein
LIYVCTGFFLTKIFHPNVAKNGEICVNTLKRDWKEDLGIGHILLVRRLDAIVHFCYKWPGRHLFSFL